jgi:hypothetical protein
MVFEMEYIVKWKKSFRYWFLVGTILIFMQLSFSDFSYAQQLPQPFVGLEVLELKTEARTVKIFYDPKITTVINKEPDNPIKYNIQGISGIKIIRAIRTKISLNTQEYYIIDFDEGASDDPTFIFLKEENKKLKYISHTPGTSLVIPGDGNLYISGHTNNMFDKRRKFSLNQNRIFEVQQPYYYVGLETKVKKRIELYSTPQQSEVIHSLSKGSKVTVLLNKGDLYLLKTSFGLVGWIQIPYGSQEASIENLYFAGD